MQAGKLDRRITLQRKTVTLSASGQPVETWATLATVWASVGPVRGDERFAVPQILAKEATEFQIRWSSTVAAVHPQDRVVYPSGSGAAVAVYDIAAVHEIGRREGLRLIAERRPDAEVITAGGIDADATNIINAFDVTPTTARSILISNLVSALKAGNCWNNWRAFYVLAADDTQAALINWKTPGTFTATLNGTTPTFAANLGFTGDGVPSIGGYIDSGLNPTTEGLTLSNTAAFAWSLAYGGTNPSAFEPLVGMVSGTLTIQRTNSGNMSAQFASSNTAQMSTGGDYTGLFAGSCSEITGAHNRLYWNGVLRAFGGNPGGYPNSNFCAMRGGTARGPFQIAAFGIGELIDEVQQAVLYSALHTYLEGVGAI